MRKTFVLIILSLVAFLPSAFAVSPYYPCQIGDYWLYQRSDGSTQEAVVDSIGSYLGKAGFKVLKKIEGSTITLNYYDFRRFENDSELFGEALFDTPWTEIRRGEPQDGKEFSYQLGKYLYRYRYARVQCPKLKAVPLVKDCYRVDQLSPAVAYEIIARGIGVIYKVYGEGMTAELVKYRVKPVTARY